MGYRGWLWTYGINYGPREKDISSMYSGGKNSKDLLKKYNIVLGDIVYAEAESSMFTDRWLTEKDTPRTLHHLGGKIFSVPDKRII